MARSKTCPKCHSSMTEGFVLDHGHSGRLVSSWLDGAPKKGLLGIVKLAGKKPMEIATWRCGNCGFLESYAKA